MSESRSYVDSGGVARRTLRLRFRASGNEVTLLSVERLAMICPPSVGEQPSAGVNGGSWIELRDRDDATTFFRVLNDPLRASVEIHSPDGAIRREFDPAATTTFEVLVPDDPRAQTLVVMSDAAAPQPRKRAGGKDAVAGAAREMARFDLSGPDPAGPSNPSEPTGSGQ
jgi:hypothetical protein